jgi:hypothetical protein
MEVVPLTLREANDFVSDHHRHSRRTSRDGGRFAIGVTVDEILIGVAIVGRPISRMLNDATTAEVLRLCVSPEAPRNACSFLYGRCWRIWQQMGGKRIVTYTLQAEGGASLRGAGWRVAGQVAGEPWHRPSRPRSHREIYMEPKFRWEATV